MKYRIELFRVPSPDATFVIIEASGKSDAYTQAYRLLAKLRANPDEEPTVEWIDGDESSITYGLTDIEEV